MIAYWLLLCIQQPFIKVFKDALTYCLEFPSTGSNGSTSDPSETNQPVEEGEKKNVTLFEEKSYTGIKHRLSSKILHLVWYFA